ncbi:hypothetical protein [Paenibacillus pinihumi]|uniref:hypothetical protein n=1 Tax=Paenibacillus pinihumi TaxID=669462 RepID=UPI0003FA7A21|nr:hypothetical protein [Paenibacillus pinihumi]
MKKTSLLLFFCLTFVFSGCSDSAQEQLQSWAFDVVTWDHGVYRMTNEAVNDIGKQIGVIKVQSTKERSGLPNLFSNRYKKGTRLYQIHNVDPADGIAVQENGTYYKAERVGGMKTAANGAAVFMLNI